jgi:hypothetical protein
MRCELDDRAPIHAPADWPKLEPIVEKITRFEWWTATHRQTQPN